MLFRPAFTVLALLAAPQVGAQWIPDIQREWQRNGERWFESAPAGQPHATILLKDVASREGVGTFEIWMLIDGARVRDWTASSPLRVTPGAHCIRIDMVAAGQRYEGTLAKYWPWLSADNDIELRLVRGERGFNIQYQKLSLTVAGVLDTGSMRYSTDLPRDPQAAYAYCMKRVGAAG